MLRYQEDREVVVVPAGINRDAIARVKAADLQENALDASRNRPIHPPLQCAVLPGVSGGNPEGVRTLVASGRLVLVDAADCAWASQYRWRLNDDGYVTRTEKGKTKRLHRDLLGARPGDLVDHINGDPCDNRRANLRICTHADNMKNRRKFSGERTSKYKGVWFARKQAHTARPWRAHIRISGKPTYLGSFATEIEAAKAYDVAAIEHHGAFARLNFPPASLSPHPTPAGGA